MARANDAEIFLRRALECEALAATSEQALAKNVLLQMAEGYWIMLSTTDASREPPRLPRGQWICK